MRDNLRPDFHFAPHKGWLNDPVGLFYAEGLYHLYYQHSPSPNDGAGRNMHWGHAVSDDLIQWSEQPIALHREENGTQMWSGSVIKSGGVLHAFYSSVQMPKTFEQKRALSRDGGYVWEKQPEPLLAHRHIGSRDPMVLKHPDKNFWSLVLYERKGFTFFTSHDLVDWKETGRLKGWYECPDLFQLPDPDSGEPVWILSDATGSYECGDFDGQRFSSRTPRKNVDYGPHFYAAQTWKQTARPGEIIQISWMRGSLFPKQSFNQQMSFPCSLSLSRDKSGLFLRRVPIPGLDDYFLKGESMQTSDILELFENIGEPVPSPSLIRCFLEPPYDLKLSFRLSTIRFSSKRGTVTRGKKLLGEIPIHKKLDLTILRDRNSIELFFNKGQICFSFCPVGQKRSFNLQFKGTVGISFFSEQRKRESIH